MTQKKDQKRQISLGTKSRAKKRCQSIEELKEPQHSFGQNEESIEEEDEENVQEEEEEPIERKGMILVASGELGDQVDWEPGFEALGEVRGILSRLEWLGKKESIDWDTNIGDHHYFDGIPSYFPPLYDESDFEDVFREFLAIIRDPTNEMPGMTSTDCTYISRQTNEKWLFRNSPVFSSISKD
jgi:hypothetical protein